MVTTIITSTEPPKSKRSFFSYSCTSSDNVELFVPPPSAQDLVKLQRRIHRQAYLDKYYNNNENDELASLRTNTKAKLQSDSYSVASLQTNTLEKLKPKKSSTKIRTPSSTTRTSEQREGTPPEQPTTSLTQRLTSIFVQPITDKERYFSKRKMQSEESSVSTTESQQRQEQEQIDALRNRVDSVLNSLVNGNASSRTSWNSDGSSSSSEAQQKPVAHQQTNKTDGKVWIVDPYGDQGEYEGSLDDEGLPHGSDGKMTYVDLRTYQGEWRHGQWHGRGKATFANGDTFDGMYHQDQRHGYGIYQWKDGRSYQGGFCLDQRQGVGEYKWPDGSHYKGDFHKGLRHGNGVYTFRDGSVYTGEWNKGKYHGQGECIWKDGRTYKGEWAHGKANGYGREVRADGSVRHDGLWKNDVPVRNHNPNNNSATTTK